MAFSVRLFHDAGRVLAMAVLFSIAGCNDVSTGPAKPAAIGAVAEPSKPQAPPKIELNGVAALATQWYPNNSHCNTPTENRLLREVVRQGVLMALREELQLVTRDETLGESLAIGATNESEPAKSTRTVAPLSISFHWDRTSVWHAELSGAGAPADNPIWAHDGTFKFKNRTFYAVFAAQMSELSKPIAERMRAAGVEGSPSLLNPENVPPAEVETQLGEMNFVSQYAAVRAAHLAMKDKGPSLEWLGVLVRGYANLAMLTQHTWTSQHDAFAARSILYAERLVQLSKGSRAALLHQAYAYSLIGMHGHALDLLAAAEQKAAPPAEIDTAPAWSMVIKPFAKFRSKDLEQLAAENDELTELAALLRWHVYRSYVHGRWISDVGMETMAACPEAYSVYSVMANWSALGVKRMGASAAISVFGERLPARVSSLTNLPETTRAFAVRPTPLLSRLLGVRSGGVSDRPIKIARTLRTAARNETRPTEFSWAILGELIAEEQFVQAANLLKVSGDAVEHSRGSLVEQLEPLVEGHRYAPYISTFAVSPNDAPRVAQIMREVQFVDPRPCMLPMFSKVWHSPVADGGNGNEYAYRAVWSRNFTQPNLQDNWYSLEGSWSSGVPEEHRRHFAKEFRSVSPYSPQAARMQWETAATYDAEQLAKWEQDLAEDPVGWVGLGERYYALSKLDDAERCYERSLAISPSYDATVGLANAYYFNGKREKWKPTLESYLEVEDLGLAHGQIHQQLAGECVNRRAWSEAEPHALEAAQTYAAWGLDLASVVYEGKQEWEKSEHFVAEASKSYPSHSSGVQWYFWCRRNGRGDIDAARRIAGQSVALSATRNYYDDAYRTFVYRVLEEDPAAALQAMDQQMKMCRDGDGLWNRISRLLLTVIVADETDNPVWKKQALDELRTINAQEVPQDSPDWVDVVDALIRAFEGEKLDEETLAKYDKVIEEGSANGRCNYQYFMGVALDQQGLADGADEYYRRAAFGGPFANYACTLAGNRLVERHGPDRGGVPERYAKQDGEQENAWAKSQAEANADATDNDEANDAAGDQAERDGAI